MCLNVFVCLYVMCATGVLLITGNLLTYLLTKMINKGRRVSRARRMSVQTVRPIRGPQIWGLPIPTIFCRTTIEVIDK